MRAGFIKGLLLAASIMLAGCGGREAVDAPVLTGTEQSLTCGSRLPPCPEGLHCSTDGIRGTCEFDNPAPCGPALPECPSGTYCFAYPRGYCRPIP
ncbi:hypothetical protein D7Y23_21770 [Corallococcus sp. AB050B]|nr:hypothetical protein D7Y23_21770 [Corallococcus sp. AB050B]